MALFCSLLARLWFLQVRDSTTDVQINSETVRTVRTDSPRGQILDRSGAVVLAGNRLVWIVVADPTLRAADQKSALRKTLVPKIAALLGEAPAKVTHDLDSRRNGPLETVVLAEDVSPSVRTTLAERGRDYPHIALQAISERSYPFQLDFAPQVLGYTGPVTKEDLLRHPDLGRNDTIGRSGIEGVYDSQLRGTPSLVDVNVNPAGVVVGPPVHRVAGKPGHNVQLTIDSSIQKSVQQSLYAGILVARSENDEDLSKYTVKYRAPAGSAVVLDATNGDVVAMASYPTYDNSANLGANYDQLASASLHYPLINRATSGLYAPGSTFKLITAQAAIETGTRGIYTTINDNGVYIANSRDKQRFASPGGGAGTVDLQSALTRSSDVYFYGIGDALWQRWNANDLAAGYAIQNVARAFGFGAKTKVDVDEARGVVPDAKWRADFVHAQAKAGIEPYKSHEAAYKGWQPGDNILLGVGQGDLLVTPLQLADAYAAFANGGTVWRPRLVSKVIDPRDGSAREVAPQVLGKATIPADVRNAMLAGFHGVVTDSKGTAAQAFQGFPFSQYNVNGKTGTAQVGVNKKNCVRVTAGVANFDKCIGDTSWFVGMFGGSDPQHPKYVVVVNVEQGGRGGRIAAPIARQIIEKVMRITPLTPITQVATGGVHP